MKSFWNNRYAQDEYVYGIAPNQFFKEQLSLLPVGKLLLPAEGEGRNAVFAAKLGWDVTAFDNSEEALKKAMMLADNNGVHLDYSLNTFDDVSFKNESFDVIAFIYAHSPKWHSNHKKLLKYLKPNGTVLLEGFSKNQIDNKSGGPKQLEMLFSVSEIKEDFNPLTHQKVWEEDVSLKEGKFHEGKASVIRMIGKK